MRSNRHRLNIGDRVTFFARVHSAGMANTASAVWIGDGPEVAGSYHGRVTAVYPNENFPSWELEADVRTNRGHTFRVVL